MLADQQQSVLLESEQRTQDLQVCLDEQWQECVQLRAALQQVSGLGGLLLVLPAPPPCKPCVQTWY